MMSQLWSAHSPKLAREEARQQLIETLWKQQQPDGGWTIWTFGTPETYGGGRRAESIRNELDYTTPQSDGYQTGLVIVVLREAGVAADHPRIVKAVNWLLTNQRKSGRWWTRSLNTSSRFHFISYSGTVYASLALAKCGVLEPLTE